MRAAAVTLVLARRDPVRYLALLLAVIGVVLLPDAPTESPLWMFLVVAPVFLIVAALFVPNFSSFELALPVTQSQLLWSRILASLTAIWLPLLTGVLAMLAVGKPLAGARQPAEFSLFFTASVCLATAARVSARPAIDASSWVVAALCWILAVRPLPWQAAVGLTGLVALPTILNLWWTHEPQWNWPRAPRLNTLLWPPLRLIWSWQTLLFVPIMFWLGLDRSWSLLVFAGFFLNVDTIASRFALALPVSRRKILWAWLAPLILPFLIGVAFSNRFNDPEPIANFNQPSADAGWRHYYGNPPALMIPPYYYRHTQTIATPKIVAPWGETMQPQGFRIRSAMGPSEFVYNPYQVSGNSDRFFEWQFGSATRAIYGKSLRPDELRAALREGLRPVTDQPRMLILRMEFGAAALLVVALLSAICDRGRQQSFSRHVRLLLPRLLPTSIFLAAQLFIPYESINFVERGLLYLSAILPGNPALMTLAILVAMLPLYWALETVFKQVEFPDQSKETA